MRRFKINNMNCQHCSSKVAKILSKIDSLSDLNFDMKNKVVAFNVNTEVSDNDILKLLTDQDYDVDIA